MLRGRDFEIFDEPELESAAVAVPLRGGDQPAAPDPRAAGLAADDISEEGHYAPPGPSDDRRTERAWSVAWLGAKATAGGWRPRAAALAALLVGVAAGVSASLPRGGENAQPPHRGPHGPAPLAQSAAPPPPARSRARDRAERRTPGRRAVRRDPAGRNKTEVVAPASPSPPSPPSPPPPQRSVPAQAPGPVEPPAPLRPEPPVPTARLPEPAAPRSPFEP
jgi:hypothetical protein